MVTWGKKSSDKLRNRAQVLGSSVLSSSFPSIHSCFTLKPHFLLLHVVLKAETKIKTKIWGFFKCFAGQRGPLAVPWYALPREVESSEGATSKHVLQR